MKAKQQILFKRLSVRGSYEVIKQKMKLFGARKTDAPRKTQ